MTYEIYRYIFIGSAIMAAVMLALAVILFFKLKIPRAIGDLTGSTRRKAVKIKEVHGIDAASSEVTVSTAQITQSGNLIPGTVSEKKPAAKTSKLVTDEIARSGSKATTFLTAEQTPQPPKTTTVLTENTVQKPKATVILANQSSQNTAVFEIEHDITFIHTNEIIT